MGHRVGESLQRLLSGGNLAGANLNALFQLRIEPQCLRFDFPSSGHVHHRPHHAHSLALFVMQHKAPVQNCAITSVFSYELVFLAPLFFTLRDTVVDGLRHADEIVRMNSQCPRFDAWFQVRGRVLEKGVKGLPPPELVVEQVPVPHRIVCGMRH